MGIFEIQEILPVQGTSLHSSVSSSWPGHLGEFPLLLPQPLPLRLLLPLPRHSRCLLRTPKSHWRLHRPHCCHVVHPEGGVSVEVVVASVLSHRGPDAPLGHWQSKSLGATSDWTGDTQVPSFSQGHSVTINDNRWVVVARQLSVSATSTLMSVLLDEGHVKTPDGEIWMSRSGELLKLNWTAWLLFGKSGS